MLEKFRKDNILWETFHAGTEEKCGEEGEAETMGYELTATPIPQPPAQLGQAVVGRRVKGEFEPEKKGGVGIK